MHNRIRLDTMKDVTGFSAALQNVHSDVFLTDAKNSARYKVNAKSFLSAILASSEWNEIWVYCEDDIYQVIKPWIIEGVSMT